MINLIIQFVVFLAALARRFLGVDIFGVRSFDFMVEYWFGKNLAKAPVLALISLDDSGGGLHSQGIFFQMNRGVFFLVGLVIK